MDVLAGAAAEDRQNAKFIGFRVVQNILDIFDQLRECARSGRTDNCDCAGVRLAFFFLIFRVCFLRRDTRHADHESQEADQAMGKRSDITFKSGHNLPQRRIARWRAIALSVGESHTRSPADEHALAINY
jgi:hypothetical protein